MNALEDNDLAPQDELYELFRSRRPDAAAFRDAVERRIAQKERERAEQDARVKSSAWRAALARRAAAVLPPEVARALLGGKLLSTTLALPALVLASTIGAFVASVRSLKRSTRDAAPATREPTSFGRTPEPLNREMAMGRGLIFALQFGGIAVMLGPFLLGGRHAIDLIVALLVVSMFALAVSVRGFARAGYLTRGEVAKLCAGLLAMLFMSCFLWSQMGTLVDPASELGLGWSAGVVLAGLAVCAALTRHAHGAARGAFKFAIAWIVLIVLVFPGLWIKPGAAGVRDYVEGFAADTNEWNGWREVEASVEALRAAGEEVPDLTRIRAAIEHAIGGDGILDQVWTAGAGMRVIDDAHWAELAAKPTESYALDQLLASPGPLRMMEYDAYELDMLLAVRELTREQRETLYARVEATWPKADDQRPLDKAALCVRLFDVLDRPDAVDRHRADIHELLRRHWVSGRGAGPFAKVGGFTSFPAKLETSFPEATWRAIQLMARAGAPAEIDLRMLRGYLRAEGGKYLFFWNAYADTGAVERASLLRLEREIGLPPRSWLAALLGERVLISTALIVALCFVAIRAAAPAGVDALARTRPSPQP